MKADTDESQKGVQGGIFPVDKEAPLEDDFQGDIFGPDEPIVEIHKHLDSVHSEFLEDGLG